MEKLKFSKNLEEVILRIRNIKKMNHGKGGEIIEVDYSKASYWLKDDDGKMFQPFLIIFVHKESYFVLRTHLVAPNQKFLLEFFDQLLVVLETSPIGIGKILVKKQELFDLFKKTATDLNIEIEIAKRLPVVESVKTDMVKFLNNSMGKEKTSQKKTVKK